MEQLTYLKERSKSPEEKDKCDLLASCLLLSSKVGDKEHPKPKERTPARPKTALAMLGGNIWDPYETTTNREYTHKVSSVQALRPKTSNGYRNPYCLSDPVGMSIYSDEFCWKPYSKAEPIRTATATGTRNHNPNPNKNFTAWKLSREEQKRYLDRRSPWINPPSTEEIQRAMRAQFCSTYRGDFLGIPQGFQVKYALHPSLNWKKEIPRPPDTESRFNYQIQPHAAELRDFTYKYGCYANRHLPAKGAVPTVINSHIRNQESRKLLTTYERHFGKEYVDLSLLVRTLDPEELKIYLQNASNKERRALELFLTTVTGQDNQKVDSKSSQTKYEGLTCKKK
ncbi:testis-expressed protein 26 [Rhinophrynus dorsalis]